MGQATVRIDAPPTAVAADLFEPDGARAVVVFAHGSGSGRASPRNRQVADGLQEAGMATLLLDLLDAEEAAEDERTSRLRFDIPLLSARLCAALDWVADQERLAGLPFGVYGASTGAAAALRTAAMRPREVGAVVSRGGRVDLAGDLGAVRAPTLLIVGGRDPVIRDICRAALPLLGGPARLEVVPGAGHLFENPGALARVLELTRAWFVERLAEP